MNRAKVQHYVPQFLLKGFGRGKRKQIHVYDKWEDRQFVTSVQNVAAESGFYDLQVPAGILTLEEGLADLEAKTARIVQEVRRAGSLSGLTIEQIGILSLFLAVQHLRTQQFRANISDLHRQLSERMRASGFDPAKIEGFADLDEPEAIKALSMQLVNDTARELLPHLLSKAWILAKSGRQHPFLIGDHPVALHNERTFGFYGNIGFGVPGIEIYLPISDEMTLYLTCVTNVEKFEHTGAQIDELRRTLPGNAEVLRLESRIKPYLRALTEGVSLPMGPQNVVHHNALQIQHAERWIFSADGDFALVKQMIADNPNVRRGRRGKVG